MSPDELRPCAMCGRGLMHTGVPLFWRVTFERMGVDLGAVRRTSGLEKMLGNVALARVFAPDRTIADPLGASHVALICEACASEPTSVYQIGFPPEATHADDDGPTPTR